MGSEESIVKSFRTSEGLFTEANEIFKKEGFSFSEVIRLLLEATVREERIPRALSTRDMENNVDKAKSRNEYIDGILDSVLPPDKCKYTAEKRILQCIFGDEPEASKDMSNASLREWGDKWGLPDNLSIATLADLYDSDFLSHDPWDGSYTYKIDTPDQHFNDVAVFMKMRDNLDENLEKVKTAMRIKAIKVLMQQDNEEEEI